jgi:hypothetical protein
MLYITKKTNKYFSYLLAFFVIYFLKNSPQQYQLLQAHCKLYHQVFPKISHTSQTKNNQFIFFDCINLSSSFKSIHQPVAFASFQLLKFCIFKIISFFSNSSSLKCFIILLGIFSKFKKVIFILIFFIIYFSKISEFNLILFKYSQRAFQVLNIIGQLNQKCVNRSGQISE